VALALLSIKIIGGAAQWAIYLLAAASVLFLLVRHPTRRRIVVGSIAVISGALIAGVVLVVLAVINVLGVALSATTSAWTIVGFAGIALGVASFWSTKGWRTIGVSFAIIFILLAGTLGINADFGLDPTVGALAGISTLDSTTVPVVKTTPIPIPTVLDGGALWANWVPPENMPTAGTISQVTIPGLISGFNARPAGLYLPPAALVKDPPELPLVIMMMGQPGNPDPSFQQPILDAFAARHEGLAPIVLVADQIGNPAVDPLCLNTTRHGNAETYVTQDVVNWARSHLRVLQDPAHWTIAGYSNGGECALAFGAKYPNIWQNVLDISGEEYPGADQSGAVLATVFHGDRAAYEATWPVNILATGTYPDTLGIFTVGSNDYSYRKEAQIVYAAATAAHWKTTYFEVLNGGHVLGALNGGLAEGYTILYPRLGLSNPAVAP
jgi:poly(3-hydroxybutyrate) depolymerase